MGHSLMPSLSTIHTCSNAKSSSAPGMTKTCSAKKRDSVAPAMMGPPSSRCTRPPPINGTRLDDGCADAQAPVGVLIEAQNLAGEGHAQRHQQQKNADDPGELARKFVGAEQKHLRHVDEDNGDHEVRSPAVQRAQEPAQRNLVIQNVEAVPRLARRRHIDQRQQNAGDDLQKEAA